MLTTTRVQQYTNSAGNTITKWYVYDDDGYGVEEKKIGAVYKSENSTGSCVWFINHVGFKGPGACKTVEEILDWLNFHGYKSQSLYPYL